MARKRFNFWLDDKNTTDWQVNDLITTLKKAGQFTRAIREGLRLWVDLRANKTDVLFELFPHLKPKLTAGGDGSGDLGEIKAMLEIVVTGQKSGGYLMHSALPAPAPKAAPVAEVKAAPVVDASIIADNFLSMFQ